MSKSKAKGTAQESLIVNYFLEQGFDARRNPLAGTKDVGDIHIHNISAIFEVKNCVKLDLSGWMKEVEIEKENAGVRFGFCLFKRKGKSDPGQQYVLMTTETLVEILKELYPEAIKPNPS